MTDTRPIFQFALIAVGGWVLYLLAPILTPFLVGALLAYLGNPAVSRLVRWHIPRLLAVVLVFLLFVLIVIVVLFFLIPALQTQIIAFTAKVPTYIDWLQHTALPRLQSQIGIDLGIDLAVLRQALIDHWRDVGQWARSFFVYITQSGLSVVGWVVNLLLIPVVTFYLLLDWDNLLVRILELVPIRRRARVAKLARETDEVLGSFLRGQLAVMTALATLYAVGLTLVGLDLALPIGVLTGLLSFIPYLGFISGVTSALIAGYLQFQDVTMLVWIGVVFLTGQFLESLWLTPRLVGNRIGLHPVAVIFSVMAGGRLFGFTGVLLALPTAAVLKVWMRHIREFYVEQVPRHVRNKNRHHKRREP